MYTIDFMGLFADLRYINGGIHHRTKELARGTPLKGYHNVFLVTLSENGPMTAKELSGHIAVDKAHTSRAVAELLRLGYIARESSGRMARLYLTPIGEETVARNRESLDQLAREFTGQVTEEEFRVFTKVLHTFGGILKADAEADEAEMPHGHHGPHCPMDDKIEEEEE